MSILVLTLPLATGAPAPEYSYVLSQDGHQPTRHGHASAALLPASGRAAGELVALVPAQPLAAAARPWVRQRLAVARRLQAALLAHGWYVSDASMLHVSAHALLRVKESSRTIRGRKKP